MNTNKYRAAGPPPPLLHLMEERAGERRHPRNYVANQELPLSPALSPLVPRGEREKTIRRNDALDQAVQITRRDFLATSASGLGTLALTTTHV